MWIGLITTDDDDYYNDEDRDDGEGERDMPTEKQIRVSQHVWEWECRDIMQALLAMAV